MLIDSLFKRDGAFASVLFEGAGEIGQTFEPGIETRFSRVTPHQ
jgi:hypothetical protein